MGIVTLREIQFRSDGSATVERLQSIQILRAVAALGVVATHLTAEFNSSGAAGAFPTFVAGSAGVDLFFVISGFVMVHSSQRLYKSDNARVVFIINRLTRIVPIYWIAITIFLLFIFIAQNKSGDEADMSAASTLASYFFIPWPRPSGHVVPSLALGWTLNYEMFFYVVFAICLFGSPLLTVTMTSAVLIGLIALAPKVGPLAFWSDPITAEFIFGMILALAFNSGFGLQRKMAPILVASGLAFVFLGEHNEIVPLHRSMTWGFGAALIVTAFTLCRFEKSNSMLARFLTFLGDCSYSLYLFHMMAFSIPRRISPDLISSGFPIYHPIMFAILISASAIVSSMIIHIVVERPIIKILKRCITNDMTINHVIPTHRDGSRAKI